MEQPIITGIAHDLGDAKIVVTAVPDKPGEAAAIFTAVAEAGVNIDMIVQNVSSGSGQTTDITFTLPKNAVAAARAALSERREAIGFASLLVDDEIAKVSLVGAGMRSHPGVSAQFFSALAGAGVNVEMISTSEIRISVIVRAVDAPTAVRALHTSFGLDSPEEAVVYAGTGR